MLALVKTMPKYEDLMDLRQNVIPPMHRFDNMMQQYTQEHEEFKKMIIKLDKLLLLKANKNQLIEHEIHTRQNFGPVTTFKGVTAMHIGRI